MICNKIHDRSFSEQKQAAVSRDRICKGNGLRLMDSIDLSCVFYIRLQNWPATETGEYVTVKAERMSGN